jgi:hypothetical protein
LTEFFQIADLPPDESDAVEQIAAILVSAFPHWLSTMEEAR